jgi:hypothetical protein
MTDISFSRLTPTRNEQVSVTATVGKIAEDRSELQPRQGIIITNTSPTAGTDYIYIYFGSDGVATTTSYKLDVNDTISDITDGGYICNQGTITAVCATANGKLNIIER